MKNISLFNVSAMVCVAIMASFYVNAKHGVLTESELVKATVKQNDELVDNVAFRALDTDNDGLLSQPEVDASQNKLLMQSFKRIDSNGDNTLSQQELSNFVTFIQES